VRRPFDTLSRRGQIGRLRTLAREALRRYDVEVDRVSFAAQAFNTVFRVDASKGTSYALRVSPAIRIHADGCEALEAAWVTALRRDAGFPTPAVVPSRDASADGWTQVDGVPEPRSCLLFEWVAGRPLREQMSADLVREVGRLTAVVHDHASADASFLSSTSPANASADVSVPSSHSPENASADAPSGALVADRVLYFRAPNRLDELRPTYGSVLAEAVDRAQRALDALWRNPPHAPHLLHGDIQPGNVMVSRGHVALIDFQDLIWGFEIQDVVIALQALDHFDAAEAFFEAFRAGYEEVRPWPDAEPEIIGALNAARHLNVLNFGMSMGKPGLEPFIARHAEPVAEWMARTTGR